MVFKNLSLLKQYEEKISTSHSLNYQSNDINNSLNFSNNFSSDDYGYGNITYHNQNNLILIYFMVITILHL